MQGAACDLLDPVGDAQPMQRPERQGLQDQQVESSLKERCFGHWISIV